VAPGLAFNRQAAGGQIRIAIAIRCFLILAAFAMPNESCGIRFVSKINKLMAFSAMMVTHSWEGHPG
jgi:hypothetical protein